MIRTGIIGFGLSGRVFHSPFLNAHPAYELVSVMTRNPEARAFLSGLDSRPTAVDTPEEILGDPSIDLVIVASPNTTHHPLAKAALEAGKHVVVEKPFTVTSREAEDLIETAEGANRLLTVYQNRRYDGEFLTLKKLMAQGALGRIVAYESTFDRFRPEPKINWREDVLPGSGNLYDLGPHLIDQALSLFGWPDRLLADIRCERNGAQVDDAFEITLYYPDLRVDLRARSLLAGHPMKLMVRGTEGTYIKYGLDPQEARLRAGWEGSLDALGIEETKAHGRLETLEGGMSIPTVAGNYRVFYDTLAEAIEGRGEVPVDPREARDVIRLIEWAERSAAAGQVLEPKKGGEQDD